MTINELIKSHPLTKEWTLFPQAKNPDFELRVNIVDGKPVLQPDIYFTLLSPDKTLRMNVRTRHENILEIYPLAKKDDFHEFNLPEDISEPWTQPYVSVDLFRQSISHLYWVPKDEKNVIYRKDLKNNIRKYKYYRWTHKNEMTPEERAIYEEYQPFYVFFYYDDDKLTSALMSYFHGYGEGDYDKAKKLSLSELTF